MRRLAEPLAFLCLASAVHAAAWLGLGGGAAGEGGAGAGAGAPLALEAADAATAALVARWDRPPDVAGTSDLPAPEVPALAAPAPPAPPAAEAGPATAALHLPPHLSSEAAPRADTAAPVYSEPHRPRPRPARSQTAAEAPGAARAEAEARAATPGPSDAPRASRTGDGAGSNAGAATPGPSAGALSALEAQWGAAILARVARQQRYPQGEHGSGTARVVLSVGRDGRLAGVSLAASSGSAALDRAALEAVRRAGRFPAAPQGLTGASYSFRIPMTFRRD